MDNFDIIYSTPAHEDLERLPPRRAAQIVKKIGRLKTGLHGDIKRLQEHDVTNRLRMGDYRILFDVAAGVSSSAESKIAKKLMTKVVLDRVGAEIKRRRADVTRLHAELEDLEDYLDVLEARQKAVGKRTYTQREMEKRFRSGK